MIRKQGGKCFVDTMGFMNYLLSLGGESRECLRDIPMLLKLEEEKGIRLDDYIPYNEDYNKILEFSFMEKV
jgi:hypothetical protein